MALRFRYRKLRPDQTYSRLLPVRKKAARFAGLPPDGNVTETGFEGAMRDKVAA